MTSSDITGWTAGALSEAIHARRVSCVEVMQATLERIARFNPLHNAIVSLREPDALLAEARAHDALLARGQSLGWMHGMPQAIKDMALTQGLTTTFGSPLMRHHVPTQDGLMVQRMKAAGCIVIGKTNTPEFGLGSHTFNEVFGVTRNAYDPSRSAGGSSGGAAVALALRLLPVADGSDFMGSLRNPAAWNNVIGLRPSQGRVPSWPTPDVWVSQLGTEGPMGRCVADVRALLRVQAGYDPRCPLSLADEAPLQQHAVAGEMRPQRSVAGEPRPQHATAGEPRLQHSVAGEPPRIGWLGDLDGYLPVEPGVLAQCEQGLRRAESAGFVVEPVRANFDAARAWQTWLVWRRWLVAARLAPYLRDPAHRALMKPEALWEHDQAADLSAQAALQASEDRSALYRALAELLQRYDVLALPTTQCWPFDARERWPKAVAGRTMDTYHRWMEVVIYATLAGLPCINLPVGFGAQGLPMGMQWIGAPRGDWRLLDLAERYEAACADWLARRPDAAATEPADPHFKPA